VWWVFDSFYPKPQSIPAKSSTEEKAKMCSKSTKMFDAIETLFSVAVEGVNEMKKRDGNAHIAVL